METIYQVNADDLNEDFLEGLKASFKAQGKRDRCL